jgi:hypothetical protein
VAGDALFYSCFLLVADMLWYLILSCQKGFAYEKSTKSTVTGKINTKTDADKYIHISKIGI